MFWGKPVGRLSADKRPTVGQQSANRRPTVSRQSADSPPTDGRQSADSQPTVGRQTADSRPTDGRQSADRFFGELFFTITAISSYYFIYFCNFLRSLTKGNVNHEECTDNVISYQFHVQSCLNCPYLITIVKSVICMFG